MKWHGGKAIGVAALVVLSIGIFAWLCGPWYHGRTLTSWLGDYGNGPGDYHSAPNTDVALRGVGINAAPVLLQLLHDTNYASGLKWVKINPHGFLPATSPGLWGRAKGWFEKFPWRLRRVTTPPSWRHWKAYLGFQALGPLGNPAIPELARLAQDDPNGQSFYPRIADMTNLTAIAEVANNSSTYMAPGAGPLYPGGGTLLRTTSGNAFLVDGDIAAWSLAAIGQEAVPALVDLLHDPSPRLRARAAEALGLVGAAAEPAVPLLITNLLNPASDSEVRMRAADALGWIGRRPGETIPALVAALNDPDARTFALNSLGRFGSRATNTIPVLLAECKDYDYRVRQAAILALADVSRETALREIVPWLIARAKSTDVASHNDVLIDFKMLHLPPDVAIPFFTAALDDKEDIVKANAMRDLAEYGVQAAAAIPKLRALANDPNHFVRQIATNALARINPVN